MEVIGIDGCRGGWMIARVVDRRVESIAKVERLDDVVDLDVAAIGIDMPIGLPDAAPRASDRELRAFLGPRRSSVFPTPARSVLDAADFTDALARNRAALGVGLSIQAWHLVPKIREVDGLISPRHQPKVSEVHPESSFTAMAGGATVAARKSTAAGRAQRIFLLREHLDRVPDGLDADAIDACAAAWTAARIATGCARWFGDLAARDARGLRMTVAV